MSNTEATGGANNFQSLGAMPEIANVLMQKGITTPTPIQHATIAIGIEGQDILGIAQTGTGKTLAFGVPLLQRLSKGKGRALILAPTRELALQIDDSLRDIAQKLGIGTAVFIGGASMHLQKQMLKKNPRILIATPGRLIDHLEHRTVTLREVSILVLDEADRMLDMGFAPQLEKILREVPKDRQTMLFSATMPHAILQITTKHMKTPVHIEIAPSGTTAERVEQAMLVLHRDEKPTTLQKLLEDYTGTVLIFVRTKHGAKKLTVLVRKMGHNAAEIHSNRSLAQRRDALDGFKKGKYRILIATDIAARGIDVENIELVVNYDLPDNPEEYVHRIGRTGRAGKQGQAISFATVEQRADIRTIERLIRTTLSVTESETAKNFRPVERRPQARRPSRGRKTYTQRRRF